MIGFDPKAISYSFSKVDPALTEDVGVTVLDPEKRFKEHPAGVAHILYFHEKLEDFHWLNPKWSDPWLNIEAKDLHEVFTFEECARLWIGSRIQSRLSDDFEKNHPLLRKLDSVHWVYGIGRNWNLLVQHMNGLKRLDFGVPDFEVRLINTCGSNKNAYSEQIRSLYLDAAFGVAIYYKGEHVLTVGFFLCEEGVFISQIQLRQQKGNRFLYKLPKPYVELIVDMFMEAFNEDPVYMTEGYSAADAVKKAYGRELPETFTTEVEDQIAKVYNRRLEGYARNSCLTKEGRVFERLTPRQAQIKLAA